MSVPNDHLTALPRIFVHGKRKRADSEETQRIWDIIGISEVREPVTEFTRAYRTPGTREHKRFEAATTKEDRATLTALALLQRAYASKSPAAKDLADAAELLTKRRLPQWALRESPWSARQLSSRDWRKGAAFWYRSLLNNRMKSARLVMVAAPGGFAPAVLCPDMRTAAFVFAAFRAVKVCPGCRQLFAPDPERDAKYCSDACGQRVWQRQYRLREKRKRAGRKVSQHKTGRRK